MKKLRELIRLKHGIKLNNRKLAIALDMSASTISHYLRAIEKSGLTWPLPDDLTDTKLMELVEPHCAQLKKSRKFRTEICWEKVHKEMGHKHMTVQLLYEEYLEKNIVSNYSYSHFCREYKKWRKKQDVSMRMVHEYGDKSFIDYAGTTMPIYSRNNKAVHNAQIFISVLGGSKYTFATATLSQKIPDWIAANVSALEYFGGVPALLVPDNLKSAIKDSCKYDPVSNPTYSEMAVHYNTAILPARSYKPKDKALAENGVLIVERWIMARLRKHKFYSLAALNNKIKELIISLNNKPFQKKSGSRKSVFIEHEQAKLRPLPLQRYEIAVFKTVKVQRDYHICVDNHFYSVPYQHVGLYVESRITNNTIEVIYNGQRITSHFISEIKGERTTLDEHMPTNHREHKNWTEDIFLKWAKQIGSGTYNFVVEIINRSTHKDRSYRYHLGLKKLYKQYSVTRLEAGCLRALAIGSYEYKSISSILSKKLDLQPCLEPIITGPKTVIKHSNIRGRDYFKQQLIGDK